MKTRKNTMKEKMIAIILTIAMVLAFMPTAAFADDGSEGGSEPAKTESVSENNSSGGSSSGSSGSSGSSSSSGNSGSNSSEKSSSSDNGSSQKSSSNNSGSESKSENNESKSENNESKEGSNAKAGDSNTANEGKSDEAGKASEGNSDVNTDAEKKSESKEDADTNEETKEETKEEIKEETKDGSRQDKENAGSTDSKDEAADRSAKNGGEAENTGNDDLVEPTKPADIDGEPTNDKINQYNAEVDEYNKKVDEYNKAVDDKYEADLERVKKENEAIEEHNQKEEAKVAETAQKNADIQAQYEKDLEQYKNDKAIADRIWEKNHMTVQQYNDYVNTYYNNPADKAVTKNAASGTFDIADTYEVQEADVKSGKTFTVNITHNFQTFNTTTYESDTLYSYTETLELDENDIITLHSIAAGKNAGKYDENNSRDTRFYLNTDEAHTMGYWGAWGTMLMDNAKYKSRDDINGDYYTLSYKDGTNHYGDDTTVDITFDYVWTQLKKAKTYNVPNEPKLNLIEYTPDFREKLEDPTRKDYLTYLDAKDLLPEPEPAADPAPAPGEDPTPAVDPTDDPTPTVDPEEPTVDPVDPTDDPVDPAVDPEDPTVDPAGPVKPQKPSKPAAPSPQKGSTSNGTTARPNLITAEAPISHTVSDADTPMTASADTAAMTTTLDEPAAPAAAPSGAWALINLIATVLTAIISILLIGLWFINRKDEEEENGEESTEEKTHRKPVLRILGIIPAIVAVIVFILTEDLSLPMQMIDKYTVLMILFLAVEAAIAILAKKTREEDEEEQEARA